MRPAGVAKRTAAGKRVIRFATKLRMARALALLDECSLSSPANELPPALRRFARLKFRQGIWRPSVDEELAVLGM